MMDWDKVTPELNKKLDPANIKPAPKGKFGDYVDGYHVISEANRIFGNGGWSYEITRLERASLSEFTLKGRDGDYQQVRASYLCTVRVTVAGVCREGAAVGMGAGKPENVGDVIESAAKEAETDALKRALRTFGNTFGLALYDKDRENVGVDAPPFDPRATADLVISRLSKAHNLSELAESWRYNAEAIADVKAASEPMFAEINAAKEARKAELQPKEAA